MLGCGMGGILCFQLSLSLLMGQWLCSAPCKLPGQRCAAISMISFKEGIIGAMLLDTFTHFFFFSCCSHLIAVIVCITETLIILKEICIFSALDRIAGHGQRNTHFFPWHRYLPEGNAANCSSQGKEGRYKNRNYSALCDTAFGKLSSVTGMQVWSRPWWDLMSLPSNSDK